MTFQYKNVYIHDTALIVGPYERKGPLGSYFDKAYDDLYFGQPTWEQAESSLIDESVDLLLSKIGKNKFDIDTHISGDLLNQVTSSNYAAARIGIPFLGIYSACASSVEGLLLGANMIEARQIKNCICSVSSHNNSAEKQFRNPVEYGGPKHKTATFTVTAGVSAYLSYDKKGIKIESATIGTVTDLGVKDVNHMGAVMAPAAAKTIYQHLLDTKREINYYDLVLTGDLGRYGKDILKDYMQSEYNIELQHYNDTATMIYDLEKQPVFAGGSGPACAPLVTYGYIFSLMKKQKIHRVLLVATGSLHSPTMTNQKLTIPAIAHAVSLEVAE